MYVRLERNKRGGVCVWTHCVVRKEYGGTSLIRHLLPLGPYRRTMPRVIGAWAFSYERSTPVSDRLPHAGSYPGCNALAALLQTCTQKEQKSTREMNVS